MSDALAVPVKKQQKDDHGDEWLLAWALLLLLLGGNALRGLAPSRQRRARTLLRDKFGADALRLASAVTGGTLAASIWQAQLAQASGDYARQMAVAGAGTLPSGAVMATIETALQEQEPFLSGFAKAIERGGLSVAQIASRSILYGAVGWSAHWIAADSVQEDFTIVRYVSRDAPTTCGPCLEAERNGPYRVGNAPYPGSVCLGGGRCHCELMYEQNRAIWEKLA